MEEIKENIPAKRSSIKSLKAGKINRSVSTREPLPVSINKQLLSYIEYAKDIEIENELLKQQLKDSNDLNMSQIYSLKEIYEKEICALRKALDETYSENEALKYENKEKTHMIESWHVKFQKKIENLDSLNLRFGEQEELLMHANRKIEMLKEVQENYEELCTKSHIMTDELAKERTVRIALQNQLDTMRDEIQFYKTMSDMIANTSVNRSQISFSNSTCDNVSNVKSTELETVSAKFQEAKEQLELEFESRLGEMEEERQRQTEKMSAQSVELYTGRKQLEDAGRKLGERDEELNWLQKEVERQNAALSQLSIQRDEMVAKLAGENEELCAELMNLTDRTKFMETELRKVRVSLGTEVARCGSGRSSAVKRRGPSVGSTELVAWTTGRIKMSADNNQYNSVWLLNESEVEVNLLNWMLTFEFSSKEKSPFVFALPARIVAPGERLTFLSDDSGNQCEDENSLVMRGVPLSRSIWSDGLVCRLRNDVREEEARFELKTNSNQILVAKRSCGTRLQQQNVRKTTGVTDILKSFFFR